MSGTTNEMWKAVISYRLKDEEQKEFEEWFYRRFPGRKTRSGLLFSCMKEETRMQMGLGSIRIWSGQKELRLLYSALSGLEDTGRLLVFFSQKEFWAVPKYVLGDEAAVEEWFGQLKAHCHEGASGRMDFRRLEERCAGAKIPFFSYTRTVGQVLEGYRELGRDGKELESLRELGLFPYRHVGLQALSLEPDGIYEYGEWSAARHGYGDIGPVPYTEDTLYLMKKDGDGVMIPLGCLDGLGAGGDIPAGGLRTSGDTQSGGLDGLGTGGGAPVCGPECPEPVRQFVSLCNEKRPSGLPKLRPVKLGEGKGLKWPGQRVCRAIWPSVRKLPFTDRLPVTDYFKSRQARQARRWWKRQGRLGRKQRGEGWRQGPVSGYMLIGAAVLLTLGIAFWGDRLAGVLRDRGWLASFLGPGIFGGGENLSLKIFDMPSEKEITGVEALKEASGDRVESWGDDAWKEQYIITLPDDTVFDQVGEDGDYVSSRQYFSIRLPPGEWEVRSDPDEDDRLASSWGRVAVKGFWPGNNLYMDLYRPSGTSVPKTKFEYVEQWKERYGGNLSGGGIPLPDVAKYSYREDNGCVIVEKEIRGNGDYEGYSLDLSFWAPDYYYSVAIWPENETKENLEKARAALDTFRILDISTGICKEMEEKAFRGYYGKNTVMTSCLVLLDEEMEDEEIMERLAKVKNMKRESSWGQGGQALAVRSKDSPWLGIDSPSLQQDCYEENARKVSEIFKSDVILYDEFDGDLLMVAYCSKDQKRSCQRATSFDKWTLELEFDCHGEEQDFPEDLLQYMDLSREEASAIWKEKDVVFQMEKWEELAAHMTKKPVPREFIGLWDLAAFGDRFEIIRLK